MTENEAKLCLILLGYKYIACDSEWFEHFACDDFYLVKQKSGIMQDGEHPWTISYLTDDPNQINENFYSLEAAYKSILNHDQK